MTYNVFGGTLNPTLLLGFLVLALLCHNPAILLRCNFWAYETPFYVLGMSYFPL